MWHSHFTSKACRWSATIWKLVWVAAGTALRSVELAGLRRRDVDLDAGLLTVARAYAEPDRGQAYFGPPKSDAGIRRVVIPAGIVHLLRDHLEQYSEPGPDGLVFVIEKGRSADTTMSGGEPRCARQGYQRALGFTTFGMRG